MEKKFIVDHRAGCIAVRDVDRMTNEGNGLNEGLSSVVKFWGGTPRTKKCQACGHEEFDGWDLTQEVINEARRLCDDLNLGKVLPESVRPYRTSI